MTLGQVLNGAASGFTMVAGFAFITTYATMARWYKSVDGRMMMMLAGAITVTSVITFSLTLRNFNPNSDWLRFAQAALTLSAGVFFIYYTVQVWKIQRKGRI